MGLRELVPYVLGYTVLAAGVTVAALFGIALWLDFPLTLLALVLGGLGFAGLFPLLGSTPVGGGAAEDAAAEVGFDAGSPVAVRSLGSLSGRYAIGLYTVGLGIDGVVAITVVDMVG